MALCIESIRLDNRLFEMELILTMLPCREESFASLRSPVWDGVCRICCYSLLLVKVKELYVNLYKHNDGLIKHKLDDFHHWLNFTF